MKFNNLTNRLETLNYDYISKLNLCKKKDKTFFFVKKLKFLSLVDGSDKLFYKKIIVLFHISSNWFSRKLHVYKIINKKNMKKNTIFYQFGCSITDFNYINATVDYINNTMYPISQRIDNNLKLHYFNRYIIYKFNNLNYLLGFNNSSYFNIKIDYNIVLIFNTKKFNIQNKCIRNFYEKIFFL